MFENTQFLSDTTEVPSGDNPDHPIADETTKIDQKPTLMKQSNSLLNELKFKLKPDDKKSESENSNAKKETISQTSISTSQHSSSAMKSGLDNVDAVVKEPLKLKLSN